MKKTLAIVDYGMGNLNSVKKKLDRLKTTASITSNPKDIIKADKIILVGVGHFAKAMKNIKELNLLDTLNEVAIIKKKPVLGICLGMQLMAKCTCKRTSSICFNKWSQFTVKKLIQNSCKIRRWNLI